MTWIALMPVALSDAEKHCLETVEQLGSYITGATFSAIRSETLEALEAREFLEAHRERVMGPLVYKPTEAGRLWLRRCTEIDEYVDGPLCVLFNSLDEQTQRRFAAWAAGQLDMELHPEAEEDISL